MIDEAGIYLAKAQESLAGAESEFAVARYNNCANRCYYACFQAAVAALMREGIRPTSGRDEGGHGFVQAQFAGQLVNRRKRFPPALRDVLTETLLIRERGDYRVVLVSERLASRSLRQTRAFVQVTESRGGFGE